MWDVEAGHVVYTWEGHIRWVLSVAWAPDGQRLASASMDKTARVWDVETGHVIHTLEGHIDWVRSVAFAPNGTRLASASNDKKNKTVRVWDVLTGNVMTFHAGRSHWFCPFDRVGTRRPATRLGVGRQDRACMGRGNGSGHSHAAQ